MNRSCAITEQSTCRMLKGIGSGALVTHVSHYYDKKNRGKQYWTNRISIIIDVHEDVNRSKEAH